MNEIFERLEQIKAIAKKVAEFGGDNLIEIADGIHEFETAVRSAGEWINSIKGVFGQAKVAATTREGEAIEEDAPTPIDCPTPEELSEARVRLHQYRDEFNVMYRQAPAGAPPGAPVSAMGPSWKQFLAAMALKLIDALIKELGGDLLGAARQAQAARAAKPTAKAKAKPADVPAEDEA